MQRRTAVAAFVKTPGLSPAKTRLAKTIGTQAAETVYLDLVELTRELLANAKREASNLDPWWIVAEANGVNTKFWQDFDRMAQPQGGLGTRLGVINEGMFALGYEQFMFIGADCPLLTTQTLADTHNFLVAQTAPTAVIGRSEDGGFYLFAANFQLARPIWEGVEYSCEKTSEQLIAKVAPLAAVHELPILFDIDTDADYQRYLNYKRGSFKTL